VLPSHSPVDCRSHRTRSIARSPIREVCARSDRRPKPREFGHSVPRRESTSVQMSADRRHRLDLSTLVRPSTLVGLPLSGLLRVASLPGRNAALGRLGVPPLPSKGRLKLSDARIVAEPLADQVCTYRPTDCSADAARRFVQPQRIARTIPTCPTRGSVRCALG
jgi:hypothetical protein